MQGGGKVLKEGTAARGAGLIDQDIGDDAVVQPDGFHVLSADIQNEGGVFYVLFCRPGVGHRLHGVVLRLEGFGKELLPVAGGAHCQYIQINVFLFIAVPHLDHGFLGHKKGLSLVGSIEGVQDLLFFIHQHKLGGGAAGVNAKVHVDLLSRPGLLPLSGGLLMPFLKGSLLLLRGEEGPGLLPLAALCLKGRAAQCFQKLPGIQDPPPVFKHALQGDGRPAGHHQLGPPGDDHILSGQLQSLCKHLYKGGIEGEGASLKSHRLSDLQSLGQPAYGLLGNGVKRRQGQIRPGHALVQKGLDVCLCVDATSAGDIVCKSSLFRKGVQFLHRHL